MHATLWRLLRGAGNGIRRLCCTQPLRACCVVGVVIVVWLLIYGIATGVLGFLSGPRYAALKTPLLGALLNLFFFALFFMVLLSSALVTWSGLFRSRSALFHAQLPIDSRALYWGAAVEGGSWASWAVLVLTVPLIVALAHEAQDPRRFVPAGIVLLLVFQLCCMGAGALGAVLLARLIPLLRRGLKGLGLFLLLGCTVAIVITLGELEQRGETAGFLNDVIRRVGFVENPYLPPMWVQRALAAAMRGDYHDWLYFLALTLSSAIAFALAGEWVAQRRLRIDLDRLVGRQERQRPRSLPWRTLPLLPKDLSILIAKDLRLFRRDPAQILQYALFFGLLAFYILLLPRLGRAFLMEDWWRIAVSLLNLTAVSMALATFTGRFVYPLLSLEGRRLWVLILAPWPRERIVTAKFLFALLVGLPVACLLVSLSGLMLEMSATVIAYQAFVTACLGAGLAAGALGLGARFADYREDNPAKLVAGYGGTLNLLASLAYAALLLIGAALPLRGGGAWNWLAGFAWTITITVIWTASGLVLARRWFAADSA